MGRCGAAVLPAGARVWPIHVRGGRALETAARLDVELTDPLLVPLSRGESALLLPEPPWVAAVDRVRREARGEPHRLVVESTRGQLYIAGRAVSLSSAHTVVDLPPGRHAYLLESRDRRIAGALRVAPEGDALLRLEVDGVVRIEEGSDDEKR